MENINSILEILGMNINKLMNWKFSGIIINLKKKKMKSIVIERRNEREIGHFCWNKVLNIRRYSIYISILIADSFWIKRENLIHTLPNT